MAVCVGCGRPILDRYVLEAVPGMLQWHSACLRCVECHQLIDESSQTCFVRHHNVYCSADFHRLFARNSLTTSNAIVSNLSAAPSTKQLQSSSDVHVALSTPLADVAQLFTISSSFNVADSSRSTTAGPATSSRVRTVLTEYQLRVLRTCYAVCPRPDPATRDQLMEMTGLSSRVIRVWFQNKRCKDKKRSFKPRPVSTSSPRTQTSFAAAAGRSSN